MKQGASSKTATSHKEQMTNLLESNITEKVKTIFKDNEIEIDKQASMRQEAAKDDQISISFKTKIHEVVENQFFPKLVKLIRDNRNLKPDQKTQYAKIFDDMTKLFTSIDKTMKDSPIIKVKLNKFLADFTRETFLLYDQLHDDLLRLNEAGCCGVGACLRAFQERVILFEQRSAIWKALTQLENQNVQYLTIKPTFDEKEFRAYINKLINQTYPDQTGDVQIIEKEVVKYIEKPTVQIVEKIIEKPIVVEKIVEKIIDKTQPQKIIQPEVIEKEVVKPDRIREAHELLYGFGKPQNITEALNIYYEEAEVHHNVSACNAIGQIFLEGKFFPKDLNKSYTYYERSALEDDGEGLYRVGHFIINGLIDVFALSEGRLESREQEITEAIVLLQRAADKGNLEALCDLGTIFEHGIKYPENQHYIVEPILEQAELYYSTGKKVRYPKAICLLGLFFQNHPDYKSKVYNDGERKAIKYFQMALDMGYIKACYYLGQYYDQGAVVNKEKAQFYYKEGALKGDVDCKQHYMQYVMKDASDSGRDEDYQYAYNYLRDVLSIDPNISLTYLYLGHLYECGFGVVKDPHIAMLYYNKGAILGNAACMTKLGDFYHSGFGVAKNPREALNWYTKAAKLKDPQALINMGVIYENGYQGVTQDRVQAVNCYKEAQILGNPQGYFYIGQMYEAGRYFSKDLDQAISMYKQAALLGYQPARDILKRRNIPMIYDDGIGTNAIQMDETAELLGQTVEKFSRVGFNKTENPLISNPVIAHIGKKTNPAILQSKIRVKADQNGVFQSILQSNRFYKERLEHQG